jgi:hypothetical protein
MMAEFIIYTAACGPKARLIDNQVDPAEFNIKKYKLFFDEIRYVAFTDNPDLKSGLWEIYCMKVPNFDSDYCRLAFKIAPHWFAPMVDARASCWIEDNIELLRNPVDLVSCNANDYMYFFRNELALFPRPGCFYREIRALPEQSRPEVPLKRQIAAYETAGFPRKFGMWDSRVIFRFHNTPTMGQLARAWWCQVNEYLNIDELSLPYVLFQTGITPAELDPVVFGTYFRERNEDSGM